MRILLAVHQFLPEFSAGTELVTLGIVRELIHRGHQVRVFAGFPGPARICPDEQRLDRYEYDGIPVYRFTHAFVSMGDQANVIEQEHDNHLAAEFFRQALDDFRPDVMHAIHLARLSASPLEVCARQHIPVIYSAHDFWAICLTSQLLLPGDHLCQGPSFNSANCLRHLALTPDMPLMRRLFYRLPDWLIGGMAGLIRRRLFPPTPFNRIVRALMERPEFLRRQLNGTARIIAPSQFMADMLASHGIDRSKIVFLPNGVEVGHIQRRDRIPAPGPLRVGFVGTLAAHKGVHVLLEAIGRLEPEMNLSAVIYGMPGPSPQYVRRIESQAAGDARIRIAPSFDHQSAGEIFAGLDVVVVPSLWYENAPRVIFEAQAAGCAVVASNLGGMAEAVRHEENGLLFPRGDSVALAAILRLLAGDRALVAHLGAAASPPMSIGEHVNRLELLYHEACRKMNIF